MDSTIQQHILLAFSSSVQVHGQIVEQQDDDNQTVETVPYDAELIEQRMRDFDDAEVDAIQHLDTIGTGVHWIPYQHEAGKCQEYQNDFFAQDEFDEDEFEDDFDHIVDDYYDY